MARESVVDQIVRSLSFEVEAIPQDNATKLSSTSNSTPLNVKIRVRKKDESGMQQGILSVPKFGSPDANPERIRLISSDQTIMSFNVSMEADFVKKPKRKPRKLFFGGCLGTQYDDDEVPYTPSSAYNAKITDTSTSSKSEGVIRQKFTLSKTNYDNIDALQQYSKKHSILGKCKPGGCLDPPFSEEKYSYKPMQISKEKKPIELVTQDAVKQHAKIRLHKADNAHRTSKDSKQLSKDSFIQKPKAKTGDDSLSILSIYDNSLQGSLDSKYSDSVITYPPIASPSALINEKPSRNRISSDEKPKKSYNDSIDAFFSSPRKSSRFSENTYNSADETKKENAKTLIPIPLPIPIPMRNATDSTEDTKREYTNTIIPKSMVNAPKGTHDTKKENAEAIIPISLKNSTISKSSVSFITSPQVRNSVSPKKTVLGSEPTVKIKLNKAFLSSNNAKLDDLQKQSSYTDNLENALTSIPIPIPVPLKKVTSISSSGEFHITSSPRAQDSVSPNKTVLKSEPSMISKVHKADLSTNKAKLDHLQEQLSYTDNLETDKTSTPIPIPTPLKKVTTISSSGESHITTPQVQDSVSPKKTVLKSEPSMIAKVDKADLSTNNVKLNDLQGLSSYADNLENDKTSIPIPTPIPLKKVNSISSSGESHITSPQVRDSVSPKKTVLKSEPSMIAKVDKSDLSTKNAKLIHLQDQSSYTDNLVNDKTSIPIPIPIPLKKTTTISSSGESHITSAQVRDSVSPKKTVFKSEPSMNSSELHITSPQVRDSVSPKKTVLKSEPSAISKVNKADLSTNNVKLDDLQGLSSYADNLENDKTSIPIPIPVPLKKVTSISSSGESHITSPLVRDSVSPKKTVLKSEPSMISKVDKADLSTKNAKLIHLQDQSSYTDNLVNAKTSIPIPIPIPLKKVTTISSSGESHTTSPQFQDSVSPKNTVLKSEPSMSSGELHITSPQVRDSVSPKKTVLKSEPSAISKINKADLSTNNVKLDYLQGLSSYTDNLENDKTSIPIPIQVPLNEVTSISSSGESHITSEQAQDSVSPKKTVLKSEPSMISKVNKADFSTNNAKLDDSQEHSSYTDNFNYINNKAKIAEPMIQSSYIGSIKNIPVTKAAEDKKDILSYRKSSDDNSKLLEKSSENKLDDKKLAMQEQYKNASNKIKNHGDKESLASIPQLKTQPNNYNPEKILQSQSQAMSNQNVFLSNEYISEESKRRTLLIESANLLADIDVKSGHLVNPVEQVDNISKQSYADFIPEEYDHTRIIKNNENLTEDNTKQLNKLSFPTASTIPNDDKSKNIESITDTSKSYDTLINSISNKSIKLNQRIAKDIDNKKLNKTQPDSNEDFETELILPKTYLSLDKNVQQDSTEGTSFDNENNVKKDRTITINNDQDAEPIKYNHFLKPMNKRDSKRNIDEEDNFTLIPQRNIDKEDNFALFPEHTQSTLDEEKLYKHDFLRNEKLQDPNNNDSRIKQSSFVKEFTGAEENLNAPHSIAMSNTNDQRLPDMPIDKSIFVDSLTQPSESIHVKTHKYRSSSDRIATREQSKGSMRNELHKFRGRSTIDRISTHSDQSKVSMRNKIHQYRSRPTIEQISTQSDQSKYMQNGIRQYRGRPTIERISTKIEQSKDSMRNETHKYGPTIERISIQAENRKDSTNSSQLILKPSSVSTDSKDNADNKNEASEISPETPLTIGPISLDLAFQSYVNDKNERTLKTIDTSIDHVRYPDDSITVIQSHLRPKVNEIRIPIDSDNDMTIQIQPTKSPTQPMHFIQQEPFDFNKPIATLSNTYGLSDLPNVNNYDSYLQGRHENMSYTEIPTILNSVYEQELIPLHNTINHLKKEIDSLASQQSILIDKLISARRTKPTRLLRVSSRCLCYRY